MNILHYFPFVLFIVYVGLTIGILYMIYKWVNKFISLKQEQNDLLRDIVNKMESK